MNTIEKYYNQIKIFKEQPYSFKTNTIWNELLNVTNLIEKEDLYIKGQELNTNNNNIYYILKCDTNKNIEMGIQFFLLYLLYSKNLNCKPYLGIDLEYNNYDDLKKKYKQFKDKQGRETALLQICCDLSFMKKSYIIIINPKDIEKNKLYYDITRELLCSRAIKILHGGDGLDIPYLYNDFLKNKQDIIKFTNNLYDTKFLCDYLNIIREDKTKCNIYSFLRNENIMSQKKLDELLENEHKMGKIQFVYVDIKNMTDEFTKYSIYDVIYLKELLVKVLEYNTPEIDEIIEMTRLTFLVRRNVVNLDGFSKEGNNISGKIDYFRKIYKQMISSNKNKKILEQLNMNKLKNLYK
jgi:hypothetical protein